MNNKRVIDVLDNGIEVELTFDLAAKSSLDYGPYPIMYNIQYLDPNGLQKTLSAKAGIIVGGKTLFLPIERYETDLDVRFQETKGTETSFHIANIGMNPAQFITIEIPRQDGFTVLGDISTTAEDRDSGDFTLVSYELMPSGRPESINVTFNLEYTDALGTRQKVEKLVYVPISSQQELLSAEGNQSYLKEPSILITNPTLSIVSSLPVIILLSIAVLIALFFFLRRKKNGKS